VAEDDMPKVALKSLAKIKVKTSKVTEPLEKQQGGFIIILLLLIILLFVMTPVGCATLLALLASAGVAAAP
jgi:hypothetical protein